MKTRMKNSSEFQNGKAENKNDFLISHEKAKMQGGSARMSLLILLSIFLCAAFIMSLVYHNFPELTDGRVCIHSEGDFVHWIQPNTTSREEYETIKIPKNMDDAKALGRVLSKYKDTYYVQVLCSGLGASFCYLLSYVVGRPVVYKYLTDKAVKWSQQVEKHREHLINYIIFLRITPFLPNWFINITSPVINVPLKTFFIGTFLGVAPPSFVAIKAGTTLYQLTTAGEAVSWNSVIVLMVLAVVSILPAIFQKKLKQKFE
ncbi:transmembrane protein 41B isoform X4 [Protopterus annectens]|uniref:transmembrane protein 41B isoform X4 n=1 Tax=Protopterus annectens TaxID=7888 RepID=UPI001CF93E05|nr:transmembrane protein 41B isoform X4 [Protopterus annectens]